jgi:hypothetical protein
MSALSVDHTAPLPLGYRAALDRAQELRESGSTWSWPTIAQVMGEYHGFRRSSGWWQRELTRTGRVERKPRGAAYEPSARVIGSRP